MKTKTAVEAFIESERAKGTGDQDIKHQLLDAGWQMDIIQWAMNEITGDRAVLSAPEPVYSATPFQKIWHVAKRSIAVF